jgi:hypothetical protein
MGKNKQKKETVEETPAE